MRKGLGRLAIVAILVVTLIGGIVQVSRPSLRAGRTNITAYFTNSTGIFPGDAVRILGVPVGKITTITAQPQRVKVDFWVDDQYSVPAQAKAVILSPSLVSARAIQLVPAYTDGRAMANDAVIPIERTAVPVEWDDFRQQLQKLTEALQPTQPGGVSTLGSLVNTVADNLRGQGGNIRDTIIKLSQAFSALGDHSDDLFSTLKNLSIIVSALHDSTDTMKQLNQNLAAVTALLSNDHDKVANAVSSINAVVGDVRSFVAENREPLGIASDKLASITTALDQSMDDLKQTLHIAPALFSNFVNIYQPASGSFAGAISINNFRNPISFLCGAIQAASRMGAEQSAKLCVQYLAPIVKNRQVNFPPLGANPFVGAVARPNEITYSEDWLRPDYVPPPAPPQDAPAGPRGDTPTDAPPQTPAPLPAEAPATTGGLEGLMVPPGGGS